MDQFARIFIFRSAVCSRSLSAKKLFVTSMSRPICISATSWQTASSDPNKSHTGSSNLKPTPVTVERITDNLSFRPATSQALDNTQRPIVLIYAWLVAKSKHIHKFGDFYLSKGFDVLHIKVGARQILWPPVAQSVVSQIIDFVNSPTRKSQPILVHGFSVGGYLYGETLVRICEDAALKASMTKRVKGQVFDSPVDFEGVPRGVGKAVTSVPPAQIAIKTTLEAYMALFKTQVTEHYKRSSQAFHDNPLITPSLVFYSKADPIGIPGPIEDVIRCWKETGAPVWTRWWADTPHVGHYLRDPITYTAELNTFLHNIGYTDTQHTVDLQQLRSKL